MTKHGLVAALIVVGLLGAQAMAAVTFYLSPVPLNGGTPTPTNPSATLNIGESVTWYLWAQTAAGTSTAIGIDFVETSPSVVDATDVTMWNGIINPNEDPGDPEIPENDWAIYRWNGTNVTTGALGGMKGVGGLNDPAGVNAAGFTTTKRTAGDPTWRGSSPYQWYLGSVTFTAAAVGQTNIFLTVNSLLIAGNTTLLGTVASPNTRFGADEANSAPVSTDGSTYYIATGVTGQIADATITVVPEPATIGLLALGCLSLLRRR